MIQYLILFRTYNDQIILIKSLTNEFFLIGLYASVLSFPFEIYLII